MNTQSFSIKKTVSASWAILKGNFWNFILATLVALILGSALSFVSSYGVIAYIVSYLLQIYLSLAVLMFFIKAAEGGKVSLWKFFGGIKPKMFWNFIALGILIGLLVGVIVLITGLLTAAFFPLAILGAIVIAYISVSLMFAQYFVADGHKAIESMKKSSNATVGVKWKLIGLGLVVIGINILGLLALGVGVFVSMALTMIIMAHLYVSFAKNRQISSPETSS